MIPLFLNTVLTDFVYQDLKLEEEDVTKHLTNPMIF